jgi:hypothetical protein
MNTNKADNMEEISQSIEGTNGGKSNNPKSDACKSQTNKWTMGNAE